jgi:DnaK suppressor protein
MAHIRPLPSRGDRLHRALQDRRAAAHAELEHLVHELSAATPREGDDEADRANQDMQCDFDSVRLQQVRHALQDINAALTRQAAGDYGQCVACGGDIPVQRLRSVPTARYCRTCQEEREDIATWRLAA